ncbi:hypothetical protein [Streptomyces sp. RK9]|uniref:hypothetical protein n=1 Tax=Streptomyces sp. RK9 TaxID=3239284 RepID=UPI003870A8D2
MFSRRGNRDEDGERVRESGGYADAVLPGVLARLDALTAAVRDLGDDVERHEEDIRDLLAAGGSGDGDVLDESRRRALDVADDLQQVWLRAWEASTEGARGAREQAWGVGELIRRVLGVGGVEGAGGAVPSVPAEVVGGEGGSWEAAKGALRGAAAEAGVEFSWDPVSLGWADGRPGAGAQSGVGAPFGAGVDCELWPGCVAWDPVLFVVRPAVVHRGQRVAPPMVFTGAVVVDGVGGLDGVDGLDGADRTDRVYGPDRVDGPGEVDGPDRVDRPDRVDGPGEVDGPDRVDRPGEVDKVESGGARPGVRGGEPSVVRGRGRWVWRVRGHRERRGSGGAGPPAR